jgi:hypothetical protein
MRNTLITPTLEQLLILWSCSIPAECCGQIWRRLCLSSTMKLLSNPYHFCLLSALDTHQTLPSTSLIVSRERRTYAFSLY